MATLGPLSPYTRDVRVTVASQLTPSVQVEPMKPGPASRASGGGLNDMIMGWVKPAFYVEVPTLGTISIEPWGRPTKNYGYLATALVIGGALGGLWALWEIAQSVERRRR